MNTHDNKTQENQTQNVGNSVAEEQNTQGFVFQISDNRPEAATQLKLVKLANNSPLVSQIAQLQKHVDTSGEYITAVKAKGYNHIQEIQPEGQQKHGRIRPTMQLKEKTKEHTATRINSDVKTSKSLRIGRIVTQKEQTTQRKSPGISNGSASVVQMYHPSHVKITGISHLVKMDSKGSIFDSLIEMEVSHGQDLIIDLDREHISRRGPNQESFREEDRVGDPIYRWVKVVAVDGERVPDGYFVREDAFVITPLFDKMSEDAAIQDTYENAESMEDIIALEELSTRLPDAPLVFRIGEQVAKGGTSTLHDIENHPNLLVKKGGGRLSAEALGLIKMELVGLPTVYVAQRQNCLIVTKLEIVGSKELLGRSKKPRKIADIIQDADSDYITEKTIQDLDAIWAILQRVPVNIGDFQFLIDKHDGSVILNDPVSVTIGARPAGKIKSLIEKVKAIYKRKHQE